MPQYNTDGTGVLHLKEVTPVIRAFFGCFDLDSDAPGNGKAYIARATEQTDPLWDSIRDAVLKLLKERGVQVDEDCHDADAICALRTSIAGAESEDLDAILDGIDFDMGPEFDDLFEIVQHLDDGHGLTRIEMEFAFYCDRLNLGEFGGFTTVISKDMSVIEGSRNLHRVFTKMADALQGGDLKQVANELHQHVQNLIGSIHDEATASEVRRLLQTAPHHKL